MSCGNNRASASHTIPKLDNVGGDVYNLTNSDAITAYNNNYIPDNPRRPKSRQTGG